MSRARRDVLARLMSLATLAGIPVEALVNMSAIDVRDRIRARVVS